MSHLDEDNVFETLEMAITDQADAALVERRSKGDHMRHGEQASSMRLR
ncbi:hypothetical protein LJR009_000231 [Bosea sp. LjRoot9]